MKKLFSLLLTITAWQFICGQGGVGIGTNSPNAPLQFANDVQNRKIVLYETANNDHRYFGFGINGAMLRYQTDYPHSDHAFFSGATDTTSQELMRITGTGKVGIGTNTPNAQIELASTVANRKIILYEDYVNDHQFAGFGINPGILRYQVAALGNDHVFYAAASFSASNELLRIKGNGNVGIGVNPTNLLDVGLGRSGTHASDCALYVTGYVEDFYEPIMEIRNDVGTRGIGFGYNAIFASGTDVDQPLFLAAKGSSGLFFETNGSEKMRIAATGYVGIGMLNHNILNWVDVNGFSGARSGTHATSQSLYVTGNFGAASNGVQFRHKDGTQGIGFGYNTIYAAGSNADQDLTITAKGTSGNLAFITNGTERLKITGSGNLGLGVTTPINTLDIHRGTARTNTHNGGQALYVTGGAEFRSADATTGLRIGSNDIFASGANTNIDLSLAGKGATGNITFKTNNIERARITSTGVGIGTTSPNAPLQFAAVNQNRKIVLFETVNDEHQFYGFGTNGNTLRYQTDQAASDHVFYSAIDAFTSKELMRIKGNGNVGIGTNVTNAPLQFSTTSANRKIVLYDFNNNDHQFIGLGHNTTSLRYQVDATTSAHVFYAAANSTTSNELLRIRGNGSVRITTSTFNFNRKLVLFQDGVDNDHQYSGFGINAGIMRYQIAAVADAHVFYAAANSSSSNELMRIKGNGNVGIGGVTNPNGELQLLNNTNNRKIILNEVAANDHQYSGLGTNTNIMRYQVGATGDNHVFYAATSSSSSNELMRIKGDGNVIVAGVIEIENNIAPTLINGFSNLGGGNAVAGYYKDKMGRVHLKGLVTNAGDPDLLVVFNLPVGYRPSSGQQIFVSLSNSTVCQINIEADGDVVVVGGIFGGWVSLSGISFRAD